jgi:hypothetical protein
MNEEMKLESTMRIIVRKDWMHDDCLLLCWLIDSPFSSSLLLLLLLLLLHLPWGFLDSVC